MVASHTAAPIGAAKWLGKRHPHTEPCRLGKGHTQLMSPTQGQAYIIRRQSHTSHFETPKGVSVWLATIVRCLKASSHCRRAWQKQKGRDIWFELQCAESASEHRQGWSETEPLFRVRRCISSEGTTESLSPLRGSFLSCLPYSGSASLHHLSVVLLPFGDYAVVNGLSGITQ